MKTTEQILKMPTIAVWSDGLAGIEVKEIEEDFITVVGYHDDVITADIQWSYDDEEHEDEDWFIEVYGRRYYGSECMGVR